MEQRIVKRKRESENVNAKIIDETEKQKREGGGEERTLQRGKRERTITKAKIGASQPEAVTSKNFCKVGQAKEGLFGLVSRNGEKLGRRAVPCGAVCHRGMGLVALRAEQTLPLSP